MEGAEASETLPVPDQAAPAARPGPAARAASPAAGPLAPPTPKRAEASEARPSLARPTAAGPREPAPAATSAPPRPQGRPAEPGPPEERARQPLSSTGLARPAPGRAILGARTILVIIGVVTAGLNAYHAARVEVDVREALESSGQYRYVSEAGVQTLVRSNRLIHWGGLVLGGVFLACGFLVREHPVSVTVLGLVLYLGGTAVFGVLSPPTLWQGFVVKLVFIVGLFKAMREAVKQQTEQAEAAPLGSADA